MFTGEGQHEQLLAPEAPASGAGSLLPPGTRVFASTPRFGPQLVASASCGAFLFVVFAGSQGTLGASAALALAFTLPLLLFGYAGWLARRAYAEHAAASARGEWHEGVILFPTGDLVVRFHGLLGLVDVTVEAAFLSRCDVASVPALGRLGLPVKTLEVHHVELSGRQAVLRVHAFDLADDVAAVAAAVNDLKAARSGRV